VRTAGAAQCERAGCTTPATGHRRSALLAIEPAPTALVDQAAASHHGLMDVGVFTGAGVSADKPADLPKGNELRDDILLLCRGHAAAVAGDGSDLDPAPLRELAWKLEYVVGRLEGIIGAHAANVLLSLELTVPNRTHLLLALHLIAGGRQVTLNFDQGVELAYDLLTGRARGPNAGVAAALPEWQSLAGTALPLRVVATETEFSAWAAERRRGEANRQPMLVKLHGSLARADDVSLRVTGVIVTDEPELAQLSDDRLEALRWLTECGRIRSVLVTGYSGEDIDVYESLLRATLGVSTTWAAPTLPDRVIERLGNETGANVQVGWANPASFAEHQMASILGVDPAHLPAWPSDPPGSRYPELFTTWAAGLSSWDGAEAYAWMLADAQHYDAATRVLRRVLGSRVAGSLAWTRTSVRLADALADRGAVDAKREAADIFADVTRRGTRGHGLRTYARVRWGEQQRSLTGSRQAAAAGLLSNVIALLESLPDKAGPPGRSRVLSAAAHTLLRIVDVSYQPSLPLGRRLALLAAATAGTALSARALPAAPGNRATFLTQQQIELAAYRALLGGPPPRSDADKRLRDLGERYRRMPDQRGEANIACARALLAAAGGRRTDARTLFDQAMALYERPDGTMDLSGGRLVARRKDALAI